MLYLMHWNVGDVALRVSRADSTGQFHAACQRLPRTVSSLPPLLSLTDKQVETVHTLITAQQENASGIHQMACQLSPALEALFHPRSQLFPAEGP